MIQFSGHVDNEGDEEVALIRGVVPPGHALPRKRQYPPRLADVGRDHRDVPAVHVRETLFKPQESLPEREVKRGIEVVPLAPEGVVPRG